MTPEVFVYRGLKRIRARSASEVFSYDYRSLIDPMDPSRLRTASATRREPLDCGFDVRNRDVPSFGQIVGHVDLMA